MRWQRILARAGCYAGPGRRRSAARLDALQSYLFDEQCALAGAPWLFPFGVNYVGPVIFTYGTDEQKAK